MPQQMRLTVEKRTGKGKGYNRRLRTRDMFPGIFYNAEGANTMIKVEAVPFQKVYDKVHSTRVLELEITDGKTSETNPVLIWDIVYHPIKNKVVHVDFLGVDLKKEVSVDVPVHVTGKAKGQEKDGVVSIFRDILTVTCLPNDIPDSITLDISDLDMNESISIEDIQLPKGVTVDFDENFAVVGVTPPHAELLEPVEAEEEEELEEEGEIGSEETE